jgi:transposase
LSDKDKEVKGQNHPARLAEMKPKIYAVKKCLHFLTVWNRDINAARNILRIFYSLVDGEGIPFLFRQRTDADVGNKKKKRRVKRT